MPFPTTPAFGGFCSAKFFKFTDFFSIVPASNLISEALGANRK